MLVMVALPVSVLVDFSKLGVQMCMTALYYTNRTVKI